MAVVGLAEEVEAEETEVVAEAEAEEPHRRRGQTPRRPRVRTRCTSCR